MTHQPPHSPIILDNNALVFWFSKKYLEKFERLDYLLIQAKDNRQRIIIPTPALAEFLAFPEVDRKYFIDKLRNNVAVLIAPFDEFSAIESAIIWRQQIEAGNKKMGSDDTIQKIKVDLQIVAIAKRHQAGLIVSNDKGVHSIAKYAGIKALEIDNLPLPSRQPSFL